MELRALTSMMLEKLAAGPTKEINKIKRKIVDVSAGSGVPVPRGGLRELDTLRKNLSPKELKDATYTVNNMVSSGAHKAISNMRPAHARAYLQALRNGRAMNK